MLTSAYAIHDNNLIDFARTYIHKFPETIIKSKPFLFLPENILKDLVNKYLWLLSEVDIFLSVVRWAYYQFDGTDRLDDKTDDTSIDLNHNELLYGLYTGPYYMQVEMVSMAQPFTIGEQVAHETKSYDYKPSDKIISLRKSVKSILPFIRFPTMTKKEILEKVLPEMILDKDQIVQILIYKSFQESKDKFDKPPHISFPIKSRIVIYIFKQETDFDENGLIFWIGSSKKTKQFQNPMSSNLGVIVKNSTKRRGNVRSIVGRKDTVVWTCGRGQYEPSFISVDIGERNQFIPSHYTLKHGFKDSKDSMRNWVFQGSNDDKKYYTLSIHRDDHSLNCDFATHTFPVIPPTDNELRDMLHFMYDDHRLTIERQSLYHLSGYYEWFDDKSENCTSIEAKNQLIEETFLSFKRDTIPHRFRYFRIRMIGQNSGGYGEKWYSYITVCGIELYGTLFSSC